MISRSLRLLLAASLIVACSPSPDGGRDAQGAPAPSPSTGAPDQPVSAPGALDGGPGAPKTAPPGGSAGCLLPAAGGVDTAASIQVLGRTRTFVRAVPAAYDAARAYPLVFVFHSGGRNGASARDYFGFASIAESEAVFLYPDGEDREWDLDTPAATNRDVALFDALLAGSLASLCIDPARVFATGSSMGAYFANQLGCRRGSKLRAIAPHAGSGPYDVASAYDEDGHLRCAEPAVAAMIFHGENDTSVSLADGRASRDHWSWANGCSGAPVPASPSPCVAYQGCEKPVVWCQIPNGGHRIWEGGPKATWAFFASF